MKVSNSYIGRPMERVEDLRMVRGRGTYVADVNRAGQLHAVILRSSVAHGKIRLLDATRALQLPGVRHVLTAADLGAVVPRIAVRLQPLPEL
ncbi:MAG: aerobic carbon-monoxide dehydrogenase large subunit, partial [Bradyrhizobium sp.]|nr:aerobic carbon-monoxide dehydrogenase large subunit [Bradyrhizobium sp.]